MQLAARALLARDSASYSLFTSALSCRSQLLLLHNSQGTMTRFSWGVSPRAHSHPALHTQLQQAVSTALPPDGAAVVSKVGVPSHSPPSPLVLAHRGPASPRCSRRGSGLCGAWVAPGRHLLGEARGDSGGELTCSRGTDQIPVGHARVLGARVCEADRSW